MFTLGTALVCSAALAWAVSPSPTLGKVDILQVNTNMKENVIDPPEVLADNSPNPSPNSSLNSSLSPSTNPNDSNSMKMGAIDLMEIPKLVLDDVRKNSEILGEDLVSVGEESVSVSEEAGNLIEGKP
jgi:hypothetical protein